MFARAMSRPMLCGGESLPSVPWNHPMMWTRFTSACFIMSSSVVAPAQVPDRAFHHAEAPLHFISQCDVCKLLLHQGAIA